MGMVAITYKVMPDSEIEEVSIDDIVSKVHGFNNDVYDVQLVETKPLAFGLKFVQVHVVMDDGSGLSDKFEDSLKSVIGVGEVEVLSMGLL
tara:strand:+ start:371 stop:643 length:273 start_codon:yes stop_codon:yes gene_type:complete